MKPKEAIIAFQLWDEDYASMFEEMLSKTGLTIQDIEIVQHEPSMPCVFPEKTGSRKNSTVDFTKIEGKLKSLGSKIRSTHDN